MAVLIPDARLWVAGYDLSGKHNAIALGPGVELKEAPVFGDTAMRRLAGLKSVTLAEAGYFDQDDDLLHFGNVGLVNVPVLFTPASPTEGTPAYFFRAAVAEYQRGGAVGEVHSFAVSAEGAQGEGLARGTLLVNGTKIVTGVGTAFQLGAVSATQRIWAVLMVAAASAGDTLDVVIQSDDAEAMATPTARITFAQQTGIAGVWATPVAGPVTDTWWRAIFTIGGAAPSFTFSVGMAIQ